MIANTWVRSPVSSRDRHWSTRLDCRSVLVMVPHLVAGTRLMDLLPLLECDHRVQVVFTVPDSEETWPITHEYVASLGVAILPWFQARKMEFDLVLAGSVRGIDDVAGPVLLVPHGGGFAQYRAWRPPTPAADRQPVLGLDAGQLTNEGQVRAEALVLTHDFELDVLRRTCPPAVPKAIVAGNITLDRLDASIRFRNHYRHRLGVGDGQGVVVVTSTWSENSAFGRHPDLFTRVLSELPAERYRVVGLLHPTIWAHHGRWQVRAWLADCLRRGLILLPPEDGWRSALVAANHLIGDYGSVTSFAAGIGTPVLLVDEISVPLLHGSPTAVLARRAPRWDFARPLVAQLQEQAGFHTPETYAEVRALLTARPGQASGILRQTMYRLMGLCEPVQPPSASPVPLPHVVPS
jgi:hypothetical protein